jgi:hypothetical protein
LRSDARVTVIRKNAMGYAELIEKLQALPEDKRAEVFDFVECLATRFSATSQGKGDKGGWSESDFAAFGMEQALRGMEDDPVTYSRDDLRECWR